MTERRAQSDPELTASAAAHEDEDIGQAVADLPRLVRAMTETTTVSCEHGRRYTMVVPGIPPGPNSRLHHMARYRACKTFQDAVAFHAAYLVSRNGWHKAFTQAALRVTIRHRRRCDLMDSDNAVAVCKPLIDGLKGRLIVDDGPGCITLDVGQEVGAERAVTLEITEILDQDSRKETTGHGDAKG